MLNELLFGNKPFTLRNQMDCFPVRKSYGSTPEEGQDCAQQAV